MKGSLLKRKSLLVDPSCPASFPGGNHCYQFLGGLFWKYTYVLVLRIYSFLKQLVVYCSGYRVPPDLLYLSFFCMVPCRG